MSSYIPSSRRAYYYRAQNAMKNVKKEFNRCGTSRNVQIHHKDRDKTNNEQSNLEYLCKSCHASEHEKDGISAFIRGNPADAR